MFTTVLAVTLAVASLIFADACVCDGKLPAVIAATVTLAPTVACFKRLASRQVDDGVEGGKALRNGRTASSTYPCASSLSPFR